MNVLHPNKKAAIITLLANGISQREIKRKVRVDRKTIRKYARTAESDSQVGHDISKSPGVATGSGESFGQNSPPRPPAFETPSTRDEPMPAYARSACEEHRPWIEEQVRLGAQRRGHLSGSG
ncbi:MAG: hypothetical protein PHF23_06730 [Smithellaceae bacterium]|jgi:hypothetical protein|nr:hypothetical protein [Smithellaceae bacterium]